MSKYKVRIRQSTTFDTEVCLDGEDMDSMELFNAVTDDAKEQMDLADPKDTRFKYEGNEIVIDATTNTNVDKDFLDEIIEESTKQNPDFPSLMEKESIKRSRENG